jgi:sterol desaturase/sphingolipid hydroxylase (fatty acid hydroxylase superfamily)
MSKLPRIADIHWPHLLLLAALPAWCWLAQDFALPATVTLFAWLVAAVLLLALAERRQPHRVDWHPTGPQLRRDGTAWTLNVITDAGATALLAAIAVAFFPGRSDWPLALQVVAGIAVAEFGSYWIHRLSHRDGWLWRVHLLHHRPDRLNVANALTAHPLNAAYDKLARVLPLVALGLDGQAMVAIALFGVTQSLVVHANIAGSIGPLDYLVGSARLHRLHHSTVEHEAGNFGTTIPLWDQVFGTFRRGAAPAEVGVFDPALYPGELRLGALLAWPFRRGLSLLPPCCSPAR